MDVDHVCMLVYRLRDVHASHNCRTHRRPERECACIQAVRCACITQVSQLTDSQKEKVNERLQFMKRMALLQS